MSIIKLDNIGFEYDKKTKVLENINYEFEAGKIYAVTGRSGAGKTTLLSLLSGLASPTKGSIYYQNKDIEGMDKYDFRSKIVGVVFQSFNLINNLSAVENIVLSMDIAGIKGKESEKKKKAYELLESVGINKNEAERRVLKLSGGQQQRVAIARALSHSPEVILADEPTGNLDGETQDEILEILRSLANEGKCVIVVTHSPEVAKAADEVYSLTPIR